MLPTQKMTGQDMSELLLSAIVTLFLKIIAEEPHSGYTAMDGKLLLTNRLDQEIRSLTVLS